MTRRSSISKRYEDPAPGDGEALVRVYAAGVNPIDITTRRGGAAQLEFPAGLGRDTAGVVEAVGKGVTSVTIGSEVIVYNTRNGSSELVGASQDKLFPVPEGLGLIEAVSIGITYTTAWDAVVNKAGVQSGQTVIVQGASGGVGIAAVQIAKALGVTAIGNAQHQREAPMGAEPGCGPRGRLYARRLAREGQDAHQQQQGCPHRPNRNSEPYPPRHRQKHITTNQPTTAQSHLIQYKYPAFRLCRIRLIYVRFVRS